MPGSFMIKTRLLRKSTAALATLVLALSSVPLAAAPASATKCFTLMEGVELPLKLAANDDEGTTGTEALGQYVIDVPADWDGTLIVGPSGATDLPLPYFGDMPPGTSVEDFRTWNRIRDLINTPTYPTATLADYLAFPLDPLGSQTLVQPDPYGPLPDPPYATQAAMRTAMEDGHYAVAISYGTPEQTEGLKGTFSNRVEQAKRVIERFRHDIAIPCVTIAAGVSGGGSVAPQLAEKYPALVDGAIGDSFGTSAYQVIQQFVALAVLEDKLFGWPTAWGTPANPLQTSFFLDVIPTASTWADVSDPDNAWKVEFMRQFRGIENKTAWEAADFWGPAYNIIFSYLFTRAIKVEYGDVVDLSHFDYSNILTNAQKDAIIALNPTPGFNRHSVDLILEAVQDDTEDMDGTITSDVNNELRGHPGLLPSYTMKPTIKIVHEGAGAETTETMRAERRGYSLCRDDTVSPAVLRSCPYMLMKVGTPYNHGSSTVTQFVDALHAMEGWISSGHRPTIGSATNAAFPSGNGWAGELFGAKPRWVP